MMLGVNIVNKSVFLFNLNYKILFLRYWERTRLVAEPTLIREKGSANDNVDGKGFQ